MQKRGGRLPTHDYQLKTGQVIQNAGRRKYIPVGLAAASLLPTPGATRMWRMQKTQEQFSVVLNALSRHKCVALATCIK
ncbi:hypothetical protein VZ94_05720, partial [Methylocucumis oryzae]